MRLSKRHVFTFSVLSLVQFNTSALNAGAVLNLIETTAAGSEGNVKSAITRKLDMQKLRQDQVERWIEDIQSLRHTHPEFKVGEQSLADALKILGSLKDYLARKVALIEGESNEIAAWAKSQGENIDLKQIKAKYLELRDMRLKYTRSSANVLQEQTKCWALLVKPESFDPVITEMNAPMRAALMLVAAYEEAQHGDEYDTLIEKKKSSSQTEVAPLSQEERTQYAFFHIIFNGGSPQKMIERMNQAYSSKELFEYLTNKAARYTVKSILSNEVIPEPTGPNTSTGPSVATQGEETQGQAEAVAPAAQVGNAANSDVAANASASTAASSSSGGAANSNKRRKK